MQQTRPEKEKMDMTTPSSSPLKRRALAPLDANVLPSPKKTAVGMDISPLKRPSSGSAPASAPASLSATKSSSAVHGDDDPRPNKRAKQSSEISDEQGDSVSDRNGISSLNSSTDLSPRPTISRQQAREKAEILRLRLSLASYKVRTGQTCVPLADLVVKPLPLTGPLPGKSISNDDGQQPDAGADNDVGDGPMDRQPCAERELSD